jgi:hypothetical protein
MSQSANAVPKCSLQIGYYFATTKQLIMSQKSIFSFNNIESPFGDWMQEIEAQREADQLQRLEEDRMKSEYNLKNALYEINSSNNPYAAEMQNNPILLAEIKGDTGIITSVIKEDGTPYYSMDQLNIIKKTAEQIDKNNGINSQGYRIIDPRDIIAGTANINPLNDVLFYLTPYLTQNETFINILEKIRIVNEKGESVGTAKIPYNMIGGLVSEAFVKDNILSGNQTSEFKLTELILFQNIGAAFNHEMNIHSYKSLFKALIGESINYNGNNDHDQTNGGLGYKGQVGGYMSVSAMKYTSWSLNHINKWNGKILKFKNEFNRLLKPLLRVPMNSNVVTEYNQLFPVAIPAGLPIHGKQETSVQWKLLIERMKKY